MRECEKSEREWGNTVVGEEKIVRELETADNSKILEVSGS